MSKRKGVPKKRSKQEEDVIVFSKQRPEKLPSKFEQQMDEIKRLENESQYPKFMNFLARLSVYYLYNASEDIKELTLFFGKREEEEEGTFSYDQFVSVIRKWKLFYQRDLQQYSEQIILLINFCSADLGLKVAPSNIPNAGNGLFATKDFPSETKITNYGGYYSEVDYTAITDKSGDYVIRLSNGGIRDALVYFELGNEMGRWINGDQNMANVKFVEVEDNKYEIWSTRTIKAGEEIYVNYGKEYRLNCRICNNLTSLMCEKTKIPICGIACHKKLIKKRAGC